MLVASKPIHPVIYIRSDFPESFASGFEVIDDFLGETSCSKRLPSWPGRIRITTWLSLRARQLGDGLARSGVAG